MAQPAGQAGDLRKKGGGRRAAAMGRWLGAAPAPAHRAARWRWALLGPAGLLPFQPPIRPTAEGRPPPRSHCGRACCGLPADLSPAPPQSCPGTARCWSTATATCAAPRSSGSTRWPAAPCNPGSSALVPAECQLGASRLLARAPSAARRALITSPVCTRCQSGTPHRCAVLRCPRIVSTTSASSAGAESCRAEGGPDTAACSTSEADALAMPGRGGGARDLCSSSVSTELSERAPGCGVRDFPGAWRAAVLRLRACSHSSSGESTAE